MMRFFTTAGLAGLAFFALAASAFAGVEEAEAHYEAGAYDAVVAAVAGDDSLPALLLTAGAYNAKALLEDDKRRAIGFARKAETFAETAVAAAPTSADAHLQYALSLAVPGQHGSVLKAYRKRLAPRTKSHLEEVLALRPADAEAMAALGFWHYEVIRRGGGRIYGGDLAEGAKWFDKAVAAAPDNPAISYKYALALAAQDTAASRRAADAMLDRAIAGSPKDYFEQAMQANAASLKRKLAEGVDVTYIAARM